MTQILNGTRPTLTPAAGMPDQYTTADREQLAATIDRDDWAEMAETIADDVSDTVADAVGAAMAEHDQAEAARWAAWTRTQAAAPARSSTSDGRAEPVPEESTVDEQLHRCRGFGDQPEHYMPADQMKRDASKASGLGTICRECHRAYRRAYNATDAGRATVRRYDATNAVREYQRRKRQSRRDVGICVPGGPGHGPSVDGWRCQPCLDRKRTSDTRRAEQHWEALGVNPWTCWLCLDRIAPGDRHIDHVTPQSVGGGNDRYATLPAHARCNTSRGDRSPAPYLAALPDGHPFRRYVALPN